MFDFLNRKIIRIGLLVVIVVGSIFFFISKKDRYVPTLISTIPKDKSENVLEKTQIEILFDSKLQEKNKSNISIILNPSFDYDLTWNLTSLKLIPKSSLDNAKAYEIKIKYKDKEIYKFNFQTEVFSQEQIVKYGNLQTKDDLLYGDTLKETVKKYPWYPSLPIKNSNYVVYYDFEKEKFAITFLKEITVQKDIDAQIKEALTKIKAVGGVEPIQYYINK